MTIKPEALIYLSHHCWSTFCLWVAYSFITANRFCQKVTHSDFWGKFSHSISKQWLTYQFSYAMRHFQASNKIDSFLKNVSNVLDSKKCRLHLWKTTYFTYNCWLVYFLFRCGFHKKIEPSWRNDLIWTVDWGQEHNTWDAYNKLIISSSAIAVMQGFFDLKIISAFFLIIGIPSTTNSKSLASR